MVVKVELCLVVVDSVYVMKVRLMLPLVITDLATEHIVSVVRLAYNISFLMSCTCTRLSLIHITFIYAIVVAIGFIKRFPSSSVYGIFTVTSI